MPLANPRAAFPQGHLFGMTAVNGTDATNDINFAAGSCRNSTNVVDMVGTALVKQIDAAWAVGTNAGGLMSAAALTDTTYFLYAIRKDSDGSVDYGFDASASAPTMPTGYTYFRRIGAVLRESSALVGFIQDGDAFWRKVPKNDADANNQGVANVAVTLGVPIGISVEAILSATLLDASPAAANSALIFSGNATNTASVATLHTIYYAASGALIPVAASSMVRARTTTAGVIRTRLEVSDADITLRITNFGWVDTRGRVA